MPYQGTRDAEAGGSNPLAPTTQPAGMPAGSSVATITPDLPPLLLITAMRVLPDSIPTQYDRRGLATSCHCTALMALQLMVQS